VKKVLRNTIAGMLIATSISVARIKGQPIEDKLLSKFKPIRYSKKITEENKGEICSIKVPLPKKGYMYSTTAGKEKPSTYTVYFSKEANASLLVDNERKRVNYYIQEENGWASRSAQLKSIKNLKVYNHKEVFIVSTDRDVVVFKWNRMAHIEGEGPFEIKSIKNDKVIVRDKRGREHTAKLTDNRKQIRLR
jgi:hypothetical protein